MSDTLPIDDIRHCPEYLRISEQWTKQTFNVEHRGGNEHTILVFKKIDGIMREIDRGTYKQLAERHGVPITTIKGSVSRRTMNQKTQYYFRKVENEV